MKYKKIITTILIGNVYIKNRVVMAPMINHHQFDSVLGTIGQRCKDYYIERIKGEVGLIITGAFKVENKIERYMKGEIVQWPLLTEKSLQDYIEIADYAHSYGTKIFVQLNPGPGRVANGVSIDAGMKPVSASANQAFWRPNVTCRPLETEEVEEIVKAIGRAAEIVAKAGMDGIEVNGHEGYLIDQFTTSLWNKRTDKYGGDLKGRLRFPIEILDEIKSKVGKNFPVIYRYGIKHFIREPWKSSLQCGEEEVGRDIKEGTEMAKLLEEAGYDALHVDSGCYESSYWVHPPTYQPHGFSLDMAAEIKKVVKIPVIAVGRLGIPELAEEALVQGKVDMIALGRALLADPYWLKKVIKGRVDDIRPCIGCHEGCLYRASAGAYLTCSVNPSCGRERLIFFEHPGKRKKIVVVGGGVAGMEVARNAAIKGHNVILFEKTGNLGGHLIEASVPGFKKDIKRLLEWYKIQINKSKIELKLNTLVTPAVIKREGPDTVIIATGSTPFIPEIPGIEKSRVVTCCDLLLRQKKIGKRIVIAGGGLVGCEVALWLAQQGKIVTIVEILPQVANDLFFANRNMLLDLLIKNKVDIITNTSLLEVTDNGVIVINKSFEKSNINCDTVVLALGMKPENELYKSLLYECEEIYKIGDCKQPRKIHDAVWDGWVIGSTI